MFSRNAITVVEKLQRQGYDAYIVGGCLRDLLLGKHQKILMWQRDARPDQIQAVFQRQCRLVGRRFRLAHIMFGRDVIEVATFRASHSDARSEIKPNKVMKGCYYVITCMAPLNKMQSVVTLP